MTALITFVFVITACGGSETTESSEYQSPWEYESPLLDTSLSLYDSAERGEELLLEALDNMALLRNEQWKEDITVELDIWHEAHKELNRLNPPEGYEDVHKAYLRYTECYSDVADDLKPAVESEDISQYISGMSLLDSCSRFYTDAGDVFRESISAP